MKKLICLLLVLCLCLSLAACSRVCKVREGKVAEEKLAAEK